jgi:hypothetical protein
MKRHNVIVLGALIGAASLSGAVQGYTTYAKWKSNPTFYLNPANSDVAASTAEAAVLAGLDAWNTQSGSGFYGNYGGRVNDTSTGYDGRNVLLFRNATSGGAIATTYSWWTSDNTLVDSDIIFWDGGFTFFGGASGCGGSNAAYIDDIAAHELGHALGLNHSGDGEATMYPSYSTCSQEMRSLAWDDIAGARSLYPGSPSGGEGGGGSVANTAPTVSISSPGNWASVLTGTSLAFSASVWDTQEGNISPSLVWTSNLEGQLGVGGSIARALYVAGTHTITAQVTDGGGLSGSSQVTVVVSVSSSTTEPIPTEPVPTEPAPTKKPRGRRK